MDIVDGVNDVSVNMDDNVDVWLIVKNDVWLAVDDEEETLFEFKFGS